MTTGIRIGTGIMVMMVIIEADTGVEKMMYREVKMTVTGAEMTMIGAELVALAVCHRSRAYWLGWENTCKGTAFRI